MSTQFDQDQQDIVDIVSNLQEHECPAVIVIRKDANGNVATTVWQHQANPLTVISELAKTIDSSAAYISQRLSTPNTETPPSKL